MWNIITPRNYRYQSIINLEGLKEWKIFMKILCWGGMLGLSYVVGTIGSVVCVLVKCCCSAVTAAAWASASVCGAVVSCSSRWCTSFQVRVEHSQQEVRHIKVRPVRGVWGECTDVAALHATLAQHEVDALTLSESSAIQSHSPGGVGGPDSGICLAGGVLAGVSGGSLLAPLHEAPQVPAAGAPASSCSRGQYTFIGKTDGGRLIVAEYICNHV